MRTENEAAAPPRDEHVRIACGDRVGRIALDRPEKLNALTLEMVRSMARALGAWRDDPHVRCVELGTTNPRAFCAGGDIGRLYESARTRDGWPETFWAEQYGLDMRIATYPKPIVAFMAGIVMGGGVGLSSHASHRVVTESTRLAMPETAIGLIPDVGATWLLSRAPGEIGTYLGLTGARIGAADAIASDLADAFVPERAFKALQDAVEREAPRDDADVRAIVARFAASPGEPPIAQFRATIDRSFAHDTVEEIVEALSADGSEFARTAAARIAEYSPTSAKLTLRALREARETKELAECFRREYRIMRHVLYDHDLREGIRAVVIDKDRAPAWKPSTLAAVTPRSIDEHFASLGASELVL